MRQMGEDDKTYKAGAMLNTSQNAMKNSFWGYSNVVFQINHKVSYFVNNFYFLLTPNRAFWPILMNILF